MYLHTNTYAEKEIDHLETIILIFLYKLHYNTFHNSELKKIKVAAYVV